MLLIGKSTMSMAIFNSKLLVNQRVIHLYLALTQWREPPSMGKLWETRKNDGNLMGKAPNILRKMLGTIMG
jgi:predicted membrane chloride channel (bestrophin family)